jgi:hypothetical protein
VSVILNQLRRRLFDTGNKELDRVLGEFARDVSDVLDQIIPTKLVEFTDTYREPLLVGFDHEPKMVVVGRSRLDATPETAIISSNAAYSYDSSARNVVIYEIDGLTVGTKYRFNMLMVG